MVKNGELKFLVIFFLESNQNVLKRILNENLEIENLFPLTNFCLGLHRFLAKMVKMAKSKIIGQKRFVLSKLIPNVLKRNLTRKSLNRIFVRYNFMA